MTIKPYVVHTDGSALNNPGPGGYGVVLRLGDQLTTLSKGYHLTTNNRMEIMAVIVALKTVGEGKKVEIYTDSEYTINAITKWVFGWKKNNWIKQDGGSVTNRDLIEELDELVRANKVTFIKVKAHSGVPDNELADKLAKDGAGNPTEVDEGYLVEMARPKPAVTPKSGYYNYKPWYKK